MFPAIFRRLFANEGKGPKLRTDIIPDTLPGKADEATRADTADKWTTARNIALSGAVTGSASVDGSKAVTITTTLANSGVTAGSYGLSANVSPADGASFNVPLIQVNAKGIITSAKTSTVKLPTKVGTADKLITARTIDGMPFDGSANITHYSICSTAAATAAKVVSMSKFTLATGAIALVRFTVTNTAANPTLNINSTGAKAIRYRNTVIPAGYLAANRTYMFVYDGSYYQLVGDVDTNTTYSVASDAEVAAGTNNTKFLTPLRLANTELEAFRKSWIGVPRWWRSTVLPPNHCWANGDFVEFADWPELKEVYDAGGFDGMLMAYNANSSTQAANLGKWRPDAAKPTGLYTPNLSEQFLRACCIQGEIGKHLPPGLPNIVGTMSNTACARGGMATNGAISGTYEGAQGPWMGDSNGIAYIGFSFNASWSNDIFGSSNTIIPETVNTPCIIYLGK